MTDSLRLVADVKILAITDFVLFDLHVNNLTTTRFTGMPDKLEFDMSGGVTRWRVISVLLKRSSALRTVSGVWGNMLNDNYGATLAAYIGLHPSLQTLTVRYDQHECRSSNPNLVNTFPPTLKTFSCSIEVLSFYGVSQLPNFPPLNSRDPPTRHESYSQSTMHLYHRIGYEVYIRFPRHQPGCQDPYRSPRALDGRPG